MEPKSSQRRVDWKVGLAIFLFTWTLTTHGKHSVSGDEPHYLMITHSVLVDHDMDVANNYANNDGRFFGHDGLDMGLHAVPALNGHVRPIHNVGLAVGLVPVYAVARTLAAMPSESILARFRMGRGLFAYSIVSIFLIAVTVHGLLSLGQGLVEVTGNARIAALLMAAAGISPPIVSHSFLVFAEVPALYVTCLAVWISLKAPAAADRIALMAVGLALGLLPWTHNKYLVYVPGLLWLIVWKRRELVRFLSTVERTVGLALFVLPQLGLQLWMWRE